MKIALIAPYFHPVEGGRERTVLFIAKGLAEKGHNVKVFTSDRTPNRGKVKIESENWNFSVRRIKSAYLAFRLEIPLERHIIKELVEFDVVHIISTDSTFTFCFLILAKIIKKHVIATVFTPLALLKHPKKILRPFLSFFEFLSLFSISLADYVQVKNEIDLKIVKKFAKRVELISDGIQDYYFMIEPPIDFKEKYKLKNKRIVLFVNRIHPLKGPQLLIKAMPEVLKVYQNAIAVLIGPDSTGYTKELKEIARKLKVHDKILFLGFISEEEKIAAYDAADVVVIPSIGEFTEGFSIVLSEAWARGKTVVVTPSRALRIRVKPETGYIADYNPSSFASTIIKALENPTKSPKVYSWREVVDMIESLYFKILI